MLCSNGHDHATVEDVKRCYGMLPAAYTGTPRTGHPAPASTERMATDAQIWKIADLGGDKAHAKTLTLVQASRVIDQLIYVRTGRSAVPVNSTPAVTAAPVPPKREEPPTKVVLALIEHLPDGYYAWSPTDDAEMTFLRVKRYKSTAKNRWAGCLLVSTQHSETLMHAWCLWPSGRISRYRNARHGFDIEDVINGLIVDHKTAAIRYGRLKGRCLCCNKDLTDPRSRHYSIGPECEKSHQYIINEVDEQNGDRSYEALLSAGALA